MSRQQGKSSVTAESVVEKALVLDRAELATETVEKVQALMEGDVVAFTEEVSAIDNVDELRGIEEKLMEVFKVNDAYLAEVSYDLPGEVEYDGVKMKRSEIVRNIIQLINKLEVEFRATLGIYQAIRYWKGQAGDKVSYSAFDSTLRMLGTLKFKGEQECLNILIINNWFASAHDAYIRDNAYTNYLAAKHQALMTRMDELNKAPEGPGAE